VFSQGAFVKQTSNSSFQCTTQHLFLSTKGVYVQERLRSFLQGMEMKNIYHLTSIQSIFCWVTDQLQWTDF